MNERENIDGTWSELEPIKASWENNKILMFFRKLFQKKEVKKNETSNA